LHKVEVVSGTASFYTSHKQTILWSKTFCKLGTSQHAISLIQLSIRHINRYGTDQNAETPDMNVAILCTNSNPRPLIVWKQGAEQRGASVQVGLLTAMSCELGEFTVQIHINVNGTIHSDGFTRNVRATFNLFNAALLYKLFIYVN
jgi:hypothetical protein